MFSLPAREELTLSIKFISIVGVYPLFIIPPIVKRRGSFQSEIAPLSINPFIFLFEINADYTLTLEYSHTLGL